MKLLATAIVLALPLLANDFSKQALNATATQRFNVSAAGVIHLENSFGEVDIDGWDRAEVEMTVDRSAERLADAKDRAEAERRLDSVQIAAKQNGNDVEISTIYPARNLFLHPLSRRSDVEIHYRIHAPRASKVIIDHNNGGVNVFDIRGDVHATVINGQITLTLGGDQYAIDAWSKIGDVYSDFKGSGQRRRVLGEEFTAKDAMPEANLYLRTRLGDIMILKMQGPPAE